MYFRILSLPRNFKIFFCVSLSILLLRFFDMSLARKQPMLALRVKTKLFFVSKNKMLLTTFFFNKLKKQKGLILTLSSFTKFIRLKSVLESFFQLKSIKIKLTILGIGYKFFNSFIDESRIIEIKAGFSHKIFFKLPESIDIVFLKPTEIILNGYCYKTLLKTVMTIKKLRLPNPYKKKGVFFKNENIFLKQGKKC